MTQSTWVEIPDSRRDTPPSRWRKLAARLLLPLAFAALLWVLGWQIPAVLVVVAVSLLTLIGALNPSLSVRIEHWMARFGVFAGRVIALVFLTIVNLFVFTPVAFIMWVFRYDALAPGVRRDEASFWHAHTGRSLPKRQFADERTMWTQVGEARPRRRPVLRMATAVGVVSLVLAGDLAGGWIYDEVSSQMHGTAAVADDAFVPADQPALRDSPWAAAMLAEQSNMGGVKDTYLGYRLGDTTGQYTNISNGERRSYRPEGSGSRLSVWFFGGSALFGDGQRDDHTIPSEFARVAESEGFLVDVHNYGRPATTVWQELELFQQLVATGQKPDLVVFYDGFNDLAGQMNQKLTRDPTNFFDGTAGEVFGSPASGKRNAVPAVDTGSAGGYGFSDVVNAYWDQSASHHVYDALHELFAGSDPTPVQFAKGVPQRDTSSAPAPDASKQAAENAVSIQGRAATVASTLAAGIGANAAFFWQPSVFTKRLLPEEEAYLKLGGYEPARWDPAIREARQLLKSTPFVDLGDALDGAPEPVLWDFVHTNEVGANLSARAMFTNLQPTLVRKLRAPSSP
ncbi:MAG: hypothetical protein QOF40_257 [Actinomycetota bacterium]|nr:hypothetical protein [Actinomycetota bacterium]